MSKPILSIIIPYYETKELTKTLLNTLKPQLNDDIEVLLINDGSETKGLETFPITIINQDNGGVSKARNTGLDNYKGDYVVFIDSDDNIKPNYIEKILNKIKNEQFNYCFFSWERQDGSQVIIKDIPPTMNNSVWNCIYDSETIGNNRFPENKQIGEEIEFNKATRIGKKANIEDILYIYNSGREGSLSTEFRKGNIQEEKKVEAQIIIYRSNISLLGGVETAIYNVCKLLNNMYDIMVVYDTCDTHQLKRLKKLVKCVKFQGQHFKCDKFIYYSINPTEIENYVEAEEYIQQMCCDIKALKQPFVKSAKTTKVVADSMATADSYIEVFPNEKCGLLNNLFLPTEEKRILYLMSATRLSWEKGYNRMKSMAKRMHEKGIFFTWEVFTNDLPDEEIDGFVFRQPRLNVTDYMWNKDYVIQLSDSESYGCTVHEALDRNIPVVCTNYKSAKEQVEDGINGFILELDLSNLDDVIDKMLSNNLKGFKRKENTTLEQWIKLLGKGKKSDYVYSEIDEEVEQEYINYNTFIALTRIKDEKGNYVKVGDELILHNSTRIKLLLDNQLIKRKE